MTATTRVLCFALLARLPACLSSCFALSFLPFPHLSTPGHRHHINNREARALSAINAAAPGIAPQLLGFLAVEGHALLFMELANAGSMHSLRAMLSEPVCAYVAACLRRAVDAMAACGWHHGDIKPGNLLLKPDGTMWVGDFNVAQPLDEAGRARGGAGTEIYMAPEALAARRGDPAATYGMPAELYSLGVLVNELAAAPDLEGWSAHGVGALALLLLPDPGDRLEHGGAALEAWLATHGFGGPGEPVPPADFVCMCESLASLDNTADAGVGTFASSSGAGAGWEGLTEASGVASSPLGPPPGLGLGLGEEGEGEEVPGYGVGWEPVLQGEGAVVTLAAAAVEGLARLVAEGMLPVEGNIWHKDARAHPIYTWGKRYNVRAVLCCAVLCFGWFVQGWVRLACTSEEVVAGHGRRCLPACPPACLPACLGKDNNSNLCLTTTTPTHTTIHTAGRLRDAGAPRAAPGARQGPGGGRLWVGDVRRAGPGLPPRDGRQGGGESRNCLVVWGVYHGRDGGGELRTQSRAWNGAVDRS